MFDELKTGFQQTLIELLEQIRLSKALAAAIRDNDTERVQFWLQEGADPNSYACIRGQITHLFLAISDWVYIDEPEYDEAGMLIEDLGYYRPMPQNFSIMTALRQWGANIDARDNSGQTPLMYAALRSLPDTLAFLIS